MAPFVRRNLAQSKISRHKSVVVESMLTNGVWSQRPVPGSSVITAINSAIEGLSRALAIELAPIRVNSISPGITDTPMYSRMLADQREATFKKTAASLTVKRIGRPEEIAEALLFLTSNGYTTWSTLFVDGGGQIK